MKAAQGQVVKWLAEETASPYDEGPPVAAPLDLRAAIDTWLGRLEDIVRTNQVACPGCEYTMHPTAERRLELRTMPYKEYLWTREWRQTRRGALQRAAYRCQLCSTRSKVLHVHHNSYARRGHEWPTDLVVLCKDCHGAHHGH
jgi:hypothetical protein